MITENLRSVYLAIFVFFIGGLCLGFFFGYHETHSDSVLLDDLKTRNESMRHAIEDYQTRMATALECYDALGVETTKLYKCEINLALKPSKVAKVSTVPTTWAQITNMTNNAVKPKKER